jgi:hypothetical protein
MSFQAYLDTIKAKTGKTPDDFRVLADKKGLLAEGVKTGQIVAWLKEDFGLGHGHAMAVIQAWKSTTQPRLPLDEKVAKHFMGEKARWQAPYDDLVAKVNTFGTGVSVAPTNSYISLLRGNKKFAIVGVTADRLDLGIKRKGAAPTERFEEAGNWNSMVTHRARISDPKQLDDEVFSWLRQAFDQAK